MHQFDPIWLRRWQVCIDVIRTPWGVCVLGENAHLNRNDMDAKITPPPNQDNPPYIQLAT